MFSFRNIKLYSQRTLHIELNLMTLMNKFYHVTKTHYENNIRGKEVKRKPKGL